MAAPSNRVPVRVARGTKSALEVNFDALQQGELSFARDQNSLYIKDGEELVRLTTDVSYLPEALDELNDVDLEGGQLDGEVLRFDEASGKWRSGRAETDLTAKSIYELADVSTNGFNPIEGHVLTFKEGETIGASIYLNGENSPDDTPILASDSRFSLIADGVRADTSDVNDEGTDRGPLYSSGFYAFRSRLRGVGFGSYMQVEPKNLDGSPSNIGTNEFTLEFWIRTGWNTDYQVNGDISGTFPRIFAPLDSERGDGGLQILQQTTSGKIDSPNVDNLDGAIALRILGPGGGTSGSYVVSTRAIPYLDGQWHHIVFSHEGEGVYSCFVDGVLAERRHYLLPFPVQYRGGTIIGARSDLDPGAYFDGDLAHIRLLNGVALHKGSARIAIPGGIQPAVEETGGWVSQRAPVGGIDGIPLLNKIYEGPGPGDTIRDDLIFELVGSGVTGETEIFADIVDRSEGPVLAPLDNWGAGARVSRTWDRASKGALYFDGQSVLRLGGQTDLGGNGVYQLPDLEGDNFTIQFWMRPDVAAKGSAQVLLRHIGTCGSLSQGNLLGGADGCCSEWVLYLSYEGKLIFDTAGSSDAMPSALTLNDGEDYFVTLQRIGGSTLLSVNGVPQRVDETSDANAYFSHTQVLRDADGDLPGVNTWRGLTIGGAVSSNRDGTDFNTHSEDLYTGFISGVQIFHHTTGRTLYGAGVLEGSVFIPPTRTVGDVIFPENEKIGTLGITELREVYVVTEKRPNNPSVWLRLAAQGSGTIAENADVEFPTSPSSGQSLVWSTTLSKWTSGSPSISLRNLSDSASSDWSPSTGDGLVYQGGQWRPGRPRNAPISLTNLEDVSAPLPSTGQVLTYLEGFGWYAAAPSGGGGGGDVDLTGVATETWVQGQGFATEAWVEGNSYASEAWVEGKSYATEAWVEGKDYTTQAWVQSQGYKTEAEINVLLLTKDYATKSWVETWSLTKSYATQSWVEDKNYATQAWVQGQGYKNESWIESQGYATETWVQDEIQAEIAEAQLNSPAQGGGIEEAPQDGNFYVRQGGQWINLLDALDSLGITAQNNADTSIASGGDFTSGASGSDDTSYEGGDFTSGQGGPDITLDGGNFSQSSGDQVSGGDFTTGASGTDDTTYEGGDFTTGQGGPDITRDGGDFSVTGGGDFTSGASGSGDETVGGGDFTSGAAGAGDETLDGGEFS